MITLIRNKTEKTMLISDKADLRIRKIIRAKEDITY